MTDSSPPSIRQAEAPAKKGGFRLRVFFLIAAPVVLLGIAGAYLLYVAPRAQGAVSPTDFLLAFAGAVALSLLVAVLFAYLADLALRRRLAAIENALREGDRNADSLAAGGARSWQGLRRLASAAQDAVSRTEDRAQDAEELKALQRAADELLEQIRGWAETEIAPSFESTGPLAELSGALQTLVRHLEERLGEGREVTELARQSVSEACESIERASRESGRSAREIAALLTAASEVKRLGAELTARLREPTALTAVEPEGAAAKPPVEIVAWRERVHTLGARLESLERLALRAALELAAEGIAERREAGPWLDRVETLRHVALGARALREEAKVVAEQTSAIAALRKAEKPAPVVAALPVEIAAMAERVEQWGSDAYSRSERLSALAQRLGSEFAAAAAAARTGADELAGLAGRFDTRSGNPGGSSQARTDAPAWRAGTRPLRLLTRDDVVAEEDEAPADWSAPGDG